MAFAASNAISSGAHTYPEFPEAVDLGHLQHGGADCGNTFGTYDDNSLLHHSLDNEVKFECAVPPQQCANDSSNLYYRTFDGSCNNLAYPGYGMANSRYGRYLKPKYGDGKYSPSRSQSGEALPNPRLLSLALFGDDTVADKSRTMWTMQWGQFVGHDISEQLESNVGKCKRLL